MICGEVLNLTIIIFGLLNFASGFQTFKNGQNIQFVNVEMNRNRKGLETFRVSARNDLSKKSISASNSDMNNSSNIKSSGQIWNIPNILTVARVLALPPFMISFALNLKLLTVSIYTLSCLTDLVDGYIARKYNMHTSFGAFLDPVADKLLVATAMALLVSAFPMWWFAIPVALILCREISISALREWMAERGARSTVKVGSLGKLKTALQMISIGLLLASGAGGKFVVDFASKSLHPIISTKDWLFSSGILGFYVATILTLVSGAQYFMDAFPHIIGDDNKIKQ